jgi:hypothetical protein
MKSIHLTKKIKQGEALQNSDWGKERIKDTKSQLLARSLTMVIKHILGHVQWGDVSIFLELPYKIFPELEERIKKKYLPLAKGWNSPLENKRRQFSPLYSMYSVIKIIFY